MLRRCGASPPSSPGRSEPERRWLSVRRRPRRAEKMVASHAIRPAAHLLRFSQCHQARRDARWLSLAGAALLCTCLGEIACAHAARDGPRGRTRVAGHGGSRGVERRRLLLSARPVARSMAARRAVEILVSGARAAGHAPPRSTPSRLGCSARGVLTSDVPVCASTRPRAARRGRVAPGPGFASRLAPASTVRCTSACTRARPRGVPRGARRAAPTIDAPAACG